MIDFQLPDSPTKQQDPTSPVNGKSQAKIVSESETEEEPEKKDDPAEEKMAEERTSDQSDKVESSPKKGKMKSESPKIINNFFGKSNSLQYSLRFGRNSTSNIYFVTAPRQKDGKNKILDKKNESPVYNPNSAKYHPINDACWKRGDK